MLNSDSRLSTQMKICTSSDHHVSPTSRRSHLWSSQFSSISSESTLPKRDCLAQNSAQPKEICVDQVSRLRGNNIDRRVG